MRMKKIHYNKLQKLYCFICTYSLSSPIHIKKKQNIEENHRKYSNLPLRTEMPSNYEETIKFFTLKSAI